MRGQWNPGTRAHIYCRSFEKDIELHTQEGLKSHVLTPSAPQNDRAPLPQAHAQLGVTVQMTCLPRPLFITPTFPGTHKQLDIVNRNVKSSNCKAKVNSSRAGSWTCTSVAHTCFLANTHQTTERKPHRPPSSPQAHSGP